MTRRFELAANHAATSWTDITSIVDRHTFRIGGRANNGESAACGFDLDDDAAAIDFPAHRVVRVVEDAPGYDYVMFWGRIEDDSVGRGTEFDGDARKFDVQLADVNAEIRGIASNKWVRPEEEPWRRMRFFLARFCDGSWRPSTVLDRHTWVPQLNFADKMEKKTYITFEGEEVVADVAGAHNQLYFVTIDREFFLNSRAYAGYASTITISDTVVEDRVTLFNPEFEGPANERNSQEVISGGIARYGDNKWVSERRTALETLGDRWQTVIDVDTVSANAAAVKLSATIDRHADREETIRCAIYVPAANVDVIKHGQVLTFRAAAAAVTTPRVLRIAEIVWEEAGPGLYKANLELSFPRKVGARINPGGGPPPVTPPNLPPFQQDCGVPVAFVQGQANNINGGGGIYPAAPVTGGLGGTPTAGNLLVAQLEAPAGVAVPQWVSAWPDGWVVYDVGPNDASLNSLMQLGLKLSDGTETTLSVAIASDGGATSAPGTLNFAEYSGFGDGVPAVSAIAHSASSATISESLPAIDPVAGRNGLVLLLLGLSNEEDAFALSATNGSYTRRLKSLDTGGFWSYLLDQPVSSASGSYGGTITRTSLASLIPRMAHLFLERECSTPIQGQPIPAELVGIGDGVRTDWQTNWAPYAAGSLQAIIRDPVTGIEQPIQVIETDPEHGLFSTAIPVPLGWELIVRYQAGAGAELTGAGNTTPDPSTTVLRFGNEVLGLLGDDDTGEVGDTQTVADAGHRHPTSALVQAVTGTPTLIAAGETFTVPANRQVLHALPIDVEGTLVVDGYLVGVD